MIKRFLVTACVLLGTACSDNTEDSTPSTSTSTTTVASGETTTTAPDSTETTTTRRTIGYGTNKPETLTVLGSPRLCETEGVQFFCISLYSNYRGAPYLESDCEILGLKPEWGTSYEIEVHVKGQDDRKTGEGCGPAITLTELLSTQTDIHEVVFIIKSFNSMTTDSLLGEPVIWENDTISIAESSRDNNGGGIVSIRSENGVLNIMNIII